jgi:hypothetical protein
LRAISRSSAVASANDRPDDPNDAAREVFAVEKLHHDERLALAGHSVVEDLDHVWVAHLGHGRRLAAEAHNGGERVVGAQALRAWPPGQPSAILSRDMAARRTAWHVLFHALLQERRPAAFEVQAEVPLGSEPQRADFFLIRRKADAPLDDARVLRGLWPRVRRIGILELKSVSRPVERGDLARLVGYGGQYLAGNHAELESVGDLLLVLVTASPTPTLDRELGFLRARMRESEQGYRELTGLGLPAVAVFLDDVCAAERDELVGLFGHGLATGDEVRHWWEAHVWHKELTMSEERIEGLEGYDDVMMKLLQSLPLELRLSGLAPEQRLAGLAPEQRLAGLPPEQRLAGLAPEQRLAGLAPEEVARALGGLPEDVLAEVRRKLGGGGPGR